MQSKLSFFFITLKKYEYILCSLYCAGSLLLSHSLPSTLPRHVCRATANKKNNIHTKKSDRIKCGAGPEADLPITMYVFKLVRHSHDHELLISMIQYIKCHGQPAIGYICTIRIHRVIHKTIDWYICR